MEELLPKTVTISNPTPSSEKILEKSLSHALHQHKGMLRVSKATSQQLFSMSVVMAKKISRELEKKKTGFF